VSYNLANLEKILNKRKSSQVGVQKEVFTVGTQTVKKGVLCFENENLSQYLIRNTISKSHSPETKEQVSEARRS
jgi:hypothetical protein